MIWVEPFAAFVVCHAAGDYLLQTEWQARHKHAGLGHDPVARRALTLHVSTYTLAFVPALAWIASARDVGLAALLGAIVFATHLVQDDGRLLHRYIRRVKRLDPSARPSITMLVDQTFHLATVFGLALLTTA